MASKFGAYRKAGDPHRHQFTTNPERTMRVCRLCGYKGVKISGRWQRLGGQR